MRMVSTHVLHGSVGKATRGGPLLPPLDRGGSSPKDRQARAGNVVTFYPPHKTDPLAIAYGRDF